MDKNILKTASEKHRRLVDIQWKQTAVFISHLPGLLLEDSHWKHYEQFNVTE
jgi:hypothetical protein